ncbi:MAG: hypothetical protein ACE5JS_19350 [Nitrospinota bacterium]
MAGQILLYVPIIHVGADLGSLAEPVAGTSRRIYGPERWRRHQEVAQGFWDAIAACFEGLDATGLKIFQDGLSADGELGRRIIDEGAQKGSRNFQIVQRLMERGAEIRKAEDPALLREEYEGLTRLVRAGSAVGRLRAYLRYRLRKGRLLARRDKFIARRINETLRVGETGVLFLGAQHKVLPLLSPDIEVKELKERARVKTYMDMLRRPGHDGTLHRLAEYLSAPVRYGG